MKTSMQAPSVLLTVDCVRIPKVLLSMVHLSMVLFSINCVKLCLTSIEEGTYLFPHKLPVRFLYEVYVWLLLSLALPKHCLFCHVCK